MKKSDFLALKQKIGFGMNVLQTRVHKQNILCLIVKNRQRRSRYTSFPNNIPYTEIPTGNKIQAFCSPFDASSLLCHTAAYHSSASSVLEVILQLITVVLCGITSRQRAAWHCLRSVRMCEMEPPQLESGGAADVTPTNSIACVVHFPFLSVLTWQLRVCGEAGRCPQTLKEGSASDLLLFS